MGERMQRGVDAFKKQKAKREQDGPRFNSSTFRLMLRDGEEASVRFPGVFRQTLTDEEIDALDIDEAKAALMLYGGYRQEHEGKKESSKAALKRRMKESEPNAAVIHTVKRGKMFDDFTCTEEDPTFGGKQCSGCHSNRQRGQHKHVGYPKDQAGFTVYDMRKQHKVEGKNGAKNEYLTCTMEEEGRCKWCSKASEKGPVFPAREVGKRKITTGGQFATQIITLHDRLAKRCISCGKGKIQIAEYLCGNPKCGDVLHNIDEALPGTKARCGTCNKKTEPKTSYKCTACDNPVPGSLMDWPCTITRSGVDKQTQYVVKEGPAPEPLPEHVRKAGVVNWLAEYKPISTTEQAALCGLPKDPFSKQGTGGKSYDDDDEDGDEGEDAEIPGDDEE